MKEHERSVNIRELIQLVREKDQNAFGELLTMYEPLVRAEVTRYTAEVEAFDVEDFRQVALLAFYRAVLNYDLAQNEVEFGLYAKICIANALASQLRVVRRHTELSVADEWFGEGDHGEGDPTQLVMEQEALQLLYNRIHTLLSPFENRVWNLYMAGYSAKKIGQMLQKETHSIENAVFRIRKKLLR